MDSIILKRATIATLLVGPLLTIINQWNALFGTASLDWTATALTFVVPFCVSSATGLFSSQDSNRNLEAMKADYVKQVSDLEAKLERERQAAKRLESEVMAVADAKQTLIEKLKAKQPSGLDSSPAVFDIPDIKLATAKIETIMSNAKQVNVTSFERVEFIQNLIDRFMSVEQSVKHLCAESEKNGSCVKRIDGDVQRISLGVEALSNGISTTATEVSEMTVTGKAFQERFRVRRSA